MFLDKLSDSLLQICSDEKLSYERAAERCACSSRHFSNIVCKRAYPTLKVFENICIGFQKSPNMLLGVETDEIYFRVPMPVTQLRMLGNFPFPVCPRCKDTFEREYQAYCDRCGQCLDWSSFAKAVILPYHK